ncbi:hypothetical protein [Actinorhabdospora filicis]|nr:hypothetical protein [Actinorhabdospora filicis]
MASTPSSPHPGGRQSYFGAVEIAPEVVDRLLDEGVWAFMRVFG